MSSVEVLWGMIALALAYKSWRSVVRSTNQATARWWLFGPPVVLYGAVLGLSLGLVPQFNLWFSLAFLILARSSQKRAAHGIKRWLLLRGTMTPPKGWAVVPDKQVLVQVSGFKFLLSPPMKAPATVFVMTVVEGGGTYKLGGKVRDTQEHWLKPDQHMRAQVGLAGVRRGSWTTVTNEDGIAKRRLG